MSIVPFLLAAAVLAITPGPGLAYVVARTVAGGRTQGLASCLGTATGGLLHVAAAAVGLSLLLAESAWAFAVVKYAGVAYLVFLGIRLLRQGANDMSREPQPTRRTSSVFIEGVIVEAMNVKTALFFLAFLPQFTSTESSLAPQLATLGAICVALNTFIDVVAVFGAHHLLAESNSSAARGRLLTKLSGGTMIGLAAFVAFARRVES